jgi:outer membrane immunogenic protein
MLRKAVLAGGVASVAFCGAAVAADMPARAPASVYTSPAPVSMWDGLYVGIHGGYASGDADTSVPGANGSGSPKGGFGGFQIGYNYLFAPNWLLGAEVDASFGDINDSTPPFASSNFKVDQFGTVRGRLGYVRGPWLIYGTAGTAWANTKWTTAPISTNRTQVGWVGGLGVEYAFTPNWSAKAEYLYADFGEARRTFGAATPINTDLTMSMVKLGLNYRFGSFGNVVSASALPASAAVSPASRWTGPYIGLHGGYGSGTFKTSAVVSTNLDPDGGFGGFQTGYNWQFAPNWVLGAETDTSWGSLKDSAGATQVKIDELGTARGRLGYAMSNVLLYGTGGLAWAHVKATTADPVSSDTYLLGWTAGAGIEYEFMPRWSAKVEYAYMNFPDTSETLAGTAFHEKLDAHLIKVGVNYHASLFGMLFNR